jgi:uncharacterized protein YbaA (DUF1428 family)
MEESPTNRYVDGFVFVVPKKNLEAYREMAKMGKETWLKHGAIDYKECVGDDLEPKPMGDEKPWSFIEMTGATPDDTVWFSFIVFNSKAHRDEVNAKVMSDPAMNDPQWKEKEMPFDMKRMSYGGFEAVVDV